MSFLDLDDFLIELAQLVDLVYCPLVDVKEYPENVDVALIEGAVADEHDLHLIRLIRERTRILAALGDCAVTGNVTALRDQSGGAEAVLKRAYVDLAEPGGAPPYAPGIIPVLSPKVMPLHAVVAVDCFIPGCPPSAARIRAAIERLLRSESPHLTGEQLRFG
jgi:NAD-reducing hydrogenase small subunit